MSQPLGLSGESSVTRLGGVVFEVSVVFGTTAPITSLMSDNIVDCPEPHRLSQLSPAPAPVTLTPSLYHFRSARASLPTPQSFSAIHSIP